MLQAGLEVIPCAEYSRAAGEQLVGTVRQLDLWLLIEHRERWTGDAIDAFPEATRRRLAAIRSRIPRLRLALIRQPQRNNGPLAAFWAFPHEHRPRLYYAEFSSIEDLPLETGPANEESAEKLFAVCTHGTHDLCCARFGNKIYSELSTLSNNVWQISHVGGCRFAPNVVCLPDGIVYGRVEQSDCSAIVNGYLNDALFVPKLRGRSCYSKPVQAAEQFLRVAKHMTALDALTLIHARESHPGHWSITFSSRDSSGYQVSMIVEDGQADTYKSCSVRELSPRRMFRLIEIDKENPNGMRSIESNSPEPAGQICRPGAIHQ